MRILCLRSLAQGLFLPALPLALLPVRDTSHRDVLRGVAAEPLLVLQSDCSCSDLSLSRPWGLEKCILL